MARVKWNTTSIRYIDSMWSNTEDWQYIRKTPELMELFRGMGESIVQELNWELHAAQARRKQPIADGYKYTIRRDEDRLRMYIWTFTARAMAHEAAHQSILKHMRFVGDTNVKGGGYRKMGGNRFTGGGRSHSATTGGPRTRTKPTPKRAALDPKLEASLRRRMAAAEALAADPGATESERKLAKEKARRISAKLRGDGDG